jgi:Ala-tRNA(Pro) deacylase
MNLTDKIKNLLNENKIEFIEIDHDPTVTSEESAKARGEDIKIGGKTLLMKDKTDFRLFVLSAAKQADSNKMRKILNSQKLRFATAEELNERAGVTKGALPPFGNPILPYELYVDQSILENEKIAFNAGLLTKSIIMSVKDWQKLVTYQLCQFAKEIE